MKSTHKRNVAAMQAAPKCQSLTAAGLPCKNPALKGMTLCQSHAFWPAPRLPRAIRRSDQRRAYVELQREIRREVREIEKLIRWAKLNEVPDYLIRELSERRGALAELAELGVIRNSTAAARKTVSVSSAPPWKPVPVPAMVARSALAKTHDELAAELIRDQALGAMLGLAVGEAVGVTTAGFERGTFREITDMHGGGLLDLKRGQWAWDTAAMLALSDSLLEYLSFDEDDFIERLLEHRDHGSYSPTGEAVGLSGMTAVALNNFAHSGKIPAGDPTAARPTNGCLSRLAPVAVRFWKQPVEMLAIARRQSAVTHAGHGLAELSERFVELIGMALGDHPREELLTDSFMDKKSGQTLTYGQLRNVPQDQIISSDDAGESFAAALWCVATGEGFEGAVINALNLAGDATSIGAMAGQLAGAIYGARQIPAGWLKQLAGRELIEGAAVRLFDAGMAQARPS